MPYLGNRALRNGRYPSEAVLSGVRFAHGAVEFAALGLIARRNGCLTAQYHLFAVAIELAFKSLALRAGAILAECKNTNHSITKMIALAERHGATVPQRLKTRLGDDRWFRNFFLLTRYPDLMPSRSLDNTIMVHSNYPEMIAEILEIPCGRPLEFERGNALAEIADRFKRGRSLSEQDVSDSGRGASLTACGRRYVQPNNPLEPRGPRRLTASTSNRPA